MICNSCGGTIGEYDRVCRHCGALQFTEQPREENPRVPGAVIALIVAALILFLVIVCVLYKVVLGDLGYKAQDATGTDASVAADVLDGADSEDGTVQTDPEERPVQTAEPTEITLVLSADALRLKPGAQIGLSVSVQAPYGQDVYVFWSSSDEVVAKIDPTGMVTAVGEGECSLIASAGEVSAECIVQVSSDVGDLSYDHLLPSDTRILTADDLTGMSQEEVMLARNEIFARHGRVFLTESIQAYFDAKAWYIPDETYNENEDGALTEMERANLQFIIDYEEERGWR